jgi:hypothetical protein
MNKEQIVDKYMKEVIPITTKFDYGILKQQLFNLLEYIEDQQLILCGVVKSLPNDDEIEKKAEFRQRPRKEQNEEFIYGFMQGVDWVKSEILPSEG